MRSYLTDLTNLDGFMHLFDAFFDVFWQLCCTLCHLWHVSIAGAYSSATLARRLLEEPTMLIVASPPPLEGLRPSLVRNVRAGNGNVRVLNIIIKCGQSGLERVLNVFNVGYPPEDRVDAAAHHSQVTATRATSRWPDSPPKAPI